MILLKAKYSSSILYLVNVDLSVQVQILSCLLDAMFHFFQLCCHIKSSVFDFFHNGPFRQLFGLFKRFFIKGLKIWLTYLNVTACLIVFLFPFVFSDLQYFLFDVRSKMLDLLNSVDFFRFGRRVETSFKSKLLCKTGLNS